MENNPNITTNDSSNQTNPNNDLDIAHKNLKSVLLVFLVVGFIGVIAYLLIQNNQMKSELVGLKEETRGTAEINKNTSVNSKDKATTVTTSNQVDAVWNTYIDDVAGFKIDYPSTWEYELVEETATQPTNLGDASVVHTGIISLEGKDGKIDIMFGDGFGGAPCGQGYLEDGETVSVVTNEHTIDFCKIEVTSPGQEAYPYSYLGLCGDCGSLSMQQGQTSYAINVYIDSPDLDSTEIPAILETFEFVDNREYRSEDNKIGFSYPGEYTLSENASMDGLNYISIISPSSPVRGETTGVLLPDELKMEVWVRGISPSTDLEEYVKEVQERNDVGNDEISDRPIPNKININGIDAYRWTYEGLGTGEIIVFINGDKGYTISKYPAETELQKDFEQILSTLKVL